MLAQTPWTSYTIIISPRKTENVIESWKTPYGDTRIINPFDDNVEENLQTKTRRHRVERHANHEQGAAWQTSDKNHLEKESFFSMARHRNM